MEIGIDQITKHLDVVRQSMADSDYERMTDERSHDLGGRTAFYLDVLFENDHTWDAVSWLVNFFSLVRTDRAPDDFRHSSMMEVLEQRLRTYLGALRRSRGDELEDLAAFVQLNVDYQNTPPDISGLFGRLEARCIARVVDQFELKMRAQDTSVFDDIVNFARLEDSAIDADPNRIANTRISRALASQMTHAVEFLWDEETVLARLRQISQDILSPYYLRETAFMTHNEIASKGMRAARRKPIFQ